MARIDTLKNFLTDIADKFREKLGTTDAISHAEYDTKIDEVYETGVNAGKEAQYDEFWDAFQNYGNRDNYAYFGCGYSWNETSFKPKYDIRPIGAAQMLFAYFQIGNLTEHLKKCGVTVDTSQATGLNDFCSYSSKLTHIPTISTVGCNSVNIFYAPWILIEIEKLILRDDGSQTSGRIGAPELQKIVVEGYWGASTQFTSTKLTAESVSGRLLDDSVAEDAELITNGKNLIQLNGKYYYGGIIGALYDLASGQTLTLMTAVKTTFYNAHLDEYADADEAWDALCDTKPNWTISLV